MTLNANPFAAVMDIASRPPVVFVSGHGSWLTDSEGNCYLEFGGGRVAKVEANFLGGPAPTALLVGPTVELAADKKAFASERRARWFG